jgi:hypothetical protein
MFFNFFKFMETKSIVQSSANVIRITKIKAGDVYKRFDTQYSDTSTYYGVVESVHNDGERTIIEATEYKYSYSSLEVNRKIISGDKDITLFPATPEDLNLELEKAKDRKEKDIQDAKEKIEKCTKELKDINELISGKKLKELSAMSYKELSQNEYNSKKLEAGL